MTVSVTVLGYAGFHTVRICNGIGKLGNTPKLQLLADQHERIKAKSDRIIIETAALCFHTVMHRYWDEDIGDFCAEDEDQDGAEYPECLMEALDFADDTVSDMSSMVPKSYLRLRALSYEENFDEANHVSEKFAAHVVKSIFSAPDPAGLLLGSVCMVASDELNPAKLDALCRASLHTGMG